MAAGWVVLALSIAINALTEAVRGDTPVTYAVPSSIHNVYGIEEEGPKDAGKVRVCCPTQKRGLLLQT